VIGILIPRTDTAARARSRAVLSYEAGYRWEIRQEPSSDARSDRGQSRDHGRQAGDQGHTCASRDRASKARAGIAPEAVIGDHPRLTRDDVRATRTFAAYYLADEALVYGLNQCALAPTNAWMSIWSRFCDNLDMTSFTCCVAPRATDSWVMARAHGECAIGAYNSHCNILASHKLRDVDMARIPWISKRRHVILGTGAPPHRVISNKSLK
jgi:hypothetical protein